VTQKVSHYVTCQRD